MTLLRMIAFEPSRAADKAGGGNAGGGKVTNPDAPPAEKRPQVVQGRANTETHPRSDKLGDTGKSRATNRDERDREWISMLSKLSVSGQVRELARNVHLRSTEGGNWSFAISPSLRHLGSKQCVDRLGRAISEQLGQMVQVSLIENSDGELLTAARISQQGQRRKQSDAERAIEDDVTIQALKERLGASIIEDSIKALQ
jgi:hypothetical protein